MANKKLVIPAYDRLRNPHWNNRRDLWFRDLPSPLRELAREADCPACRRPITRVVVEPPRYMEVTSWTGDHVVRVQNAIFSLVCTACGSFASFQEGDEVKQWRHSSGEPIIAAREMTLEETMTPAGDLIARARPSAMPFGAHKDKPFNQLPSHYLNWLLTKATIDPVLRLVLVEEKERRREIEAEAERRIRQLAFDQAEARRQREMDEEEMFRNRPRVTQSKKREPEKPAPDPTLRPQRRIRP